MTGLLYRDGAYALISERAPVWRPQIPIIVHYTESTKSNQEVFWQAPEFVFYDEWISFLPVIFLVYLLHDNGHFLVILLL